LLIDHFLWDWNLPDVTILKLVFIDLIKDLLEDIIAGFAYEDLLKDGNDMRVVTGLPCQCIYDR
jgi:hypothetical protein